MRDSAVRAHRSCLPRHQNDPRSTKLPGPTVNCALGAAFSPGCTNSSMTPADTATPATIKPTEKTVFGCRSSGSSGCIRHRHNRDHCCTGSSYRDTSARLRALQSCLARVPLRQPRQWHSQRIAAPNACFDCRSLVCSSQRDRWFATQPVRRAAGSSLGAVPQCPLGEPLPGYDDC